MASLPAIGAMQDPLKWNLPGWRIEQRFDNKVLIGNWYEERKQFERTPQQHNSTHRRDYKFHTDARPDVEIRKNAFLTNKGLPKDLLFGHHGKAYSNNMISLYDEYYNRRARPDGQKFPPVRSWDSKSMTWVPEKIDHPLQADPTNWGLKNEVAERQAKLEKEKNISDYLSTYSLGYTEKPVDVRVRRYATARDSSTKLHPVNKVNKNLNLRNATANPHMPQHLQIRSPYVI